MSVQQLQAMPDRSEYINKMNDLGRNKIPFLFIIDFNFHQIKIIKLSEIKQHDISYDLNNSSLKNQMKGVRFSKQPITFDTYKASFDIVMDELKNGNSYLTNLTAVTPISTNIDLKDIYNNSNAKYKLLYKDEFVVFSPETFIKISNGKIESCPMKGTIDASIPNAEQIILSNKKEAAEHATITDLIRNDLSRVSTNVKVDRYRYIDKLKTNQGELLQVSSLISGDLDDDFGSKIGNILFELLPAGSISGAPKQKTVEIIQKAETYQRGYYTGVFGTFDGENLDSGVMIRFIENTPNGLIFKSGGGITINSTAKEEYEELIKKVYLPL